MDGVGMAVPVETSGISYQRERTVDSAATRVSERRLSARVRAALAAMLEAHDYVQDLGASAWEFAIELATLRRLGVNNSDLRWLVAKGLVEHAVEVTRAGDAARGFRQPPHPVFSKRACFVLSPAGATLATRICGGGNSAGSNETNVAVDEPPTAESSAGPVQPVWDYHRKELRVGSQVVRQFKLPAPDQEALLAALAESDWAARIENPLPPSDEMSSRSRVQAAIEALNRGQKQPLLRFFEDHDGQNVGWESCQRATSDGRQ